jgi:5-methylcytosine-specific restriction endonuclease McrA
MVRIRDGHRCVNCGTTDSLSVHHERPVRQGGNPFDMDNLVTLCAHCHAEAERGPSVF